MFINKIRRVKEPNTMERIIQRLKDKEKDTLEKFEET
jgi:hypothetical protein